MSEVPPPMNLFRRRFSKAPIEISSIDGISIRQLEHIGDRIVGLAACEIVLERVRGIGHNESRYFFWAQRLVTNENLASAGYKNGDAVEIKIGEVYFTSGIEHAIIEARSILFQTGLWTKFERFLEGKMVGVPKQHSSCTPILHNPVLPELLKSQPPIGE